MGHCDAGGTAHWFRAYKKIRTKDAKGVAAAIISVLLPCKALVRTGTFDNGLEFSDHKSISRDLGAKIFFANPYRSWERGTNENYNGLLRQYFPKGSCFATIKTNQLRHTETELNERARKRLAWLTPAELFAKAVKRHGVAFAP